MRRQAGKLSFRRRPHSHRTCEATDRNRIEGRYPQASEPSITKPFPTGGKVNAELVQGKFTFLAGESCRTYLGVGLARKPGRCRESVMVSGSSQQRP